MFFSHLRWPFQVQVALFTPLANFLVAINASQLPLKLSSSNYRSGCSNSPILYGFNILGYVDGTFQPPSKTTLVNGSKVVNLEYEFWCCQDQLILAAIFASTSFSMMPTITTAKTSTETWN